MDLNKEQEFHLRVQAAPIANAEPLPGPLKPAFTEEDIVVGPFSVRPVKHGDWILFEKLDSPIRKMMVDAVQNEGKINERDFQFTSEEGVELCYQFTRPAKEARDALNVSREFFTSQAMDKVADKCDGVMVTKIIEAVGEQLRRYYAMAIRYGEQEQEGGEKRFFREPPA